MIVPVFRPEITLHRRADDGEWDSLGTVTNTLFYPMPDEDRPTEAGFRKVVRLGAEPFFRIEAPEGSELVEAGDKRRCVFLKLPSGKTLDATTALAFAKMRDHGLDLVRPGREPARAVFLPAPVPSPPMPVAVASRGPARQLSMFGEES